MTSYTCGASITYQPTYYNAPNLQQLYAYNYNYTYPMAHCFQWSYQNQQYLWNPAMAAMQNYYNNSWNMQNMNNFINSQAQYNYARIPNVSQYQNTNLNVIPMQIAAKEAVPQIQACEDEFNFAEPKLPVWHQKTCTQTAPNNNFIEFLDEVATKQRQSHNVDNQDMQKLYSSYAIKAQLTKENYAEKKSQDKLNYFDEQLSDLMTPLSTLPKDKAAVDRIMQQKLFNIQTQYLASEDEYVKDQFEKNPVEVVEKRPLEECANPKRSEQCRRSRLKVKLNKLAVHHKKRFAQMKTQNSQVVLANMKFMVSDLEQKLLESGKNIDIKNLKAKYGIE